MKKKLTETQPFDEPTWIFPYTGMDVGDSFFIPTMRPAYMAYVIDTTAKQSGIKCKCFTTTEKNVLGVRTWRIA
jgi:hypothetical protein